MTERYEDIVGGHDTDVPGPYRESGAWWHPCPPPPRGCGAPAEQKCTFKPHVQAPGGGITRELRERHHPCISRVTNGAKQ